MTKNFLKKFVQAHTVQNRLNIIITMIIVVLIFSLSSYWFGVKVMSGIRGYVNGEGLWSKAQKEAVTSLIRYASSGNQVDYNRYLSEIKVQDGDKLARLELDKPNPNYDVVLTGFVQGGNDPGDVDDMVFLYRQFGTVSYMHTAITIWAEGDMEMAKFRALGDQIHRLIAMRPAIASSGAPATLSPELASLLRAVYANDSRLTSLENRFSATLGAGSRTTSELLLRLTILTTGVLGLLTVITAVMTARGIVRLDKLKTEFVSLASHQLRTPLTAINWYTEALLSGAKGALSPTQRDYLTELSGGGRRMSALISDLLKVSSLDLGTYKSETAQVRVADVLETVLGDLQAEIDKKGIQVTTDIDPSLPNAKLDKQLLAAVFQNLVSNSVKYTPNGGRVAVSASRQRQNLLIHVADTGIGIPEAQQSQIFTKLFRGDNAKQLDEDGSGLGLYIVKALARRMGGSIWFTSIEGRGSDFYVKLPLYRGLNARPSK